MRCVRRVPARRDELCATYDEVGFTREGAASDQLLLPVASCTGSADDVTLLDGALVEPTAVVLQGLTKIGPRPGDEVLVLGDGTIALLVAHLVGCGRRRGSVCAVCAPSSSRLVAAVGAAEFATEESATTSTS